MLASVTPRPSTRSLPVRPADRRRPPTGRRPSADSAPSAAPFDAIPPATWDALAAANPWATPFSGWAFQRAWWDAYGANAHEETLVVVPADAPADGSATRSRSSRSCTATRSSRATRLTHTTIRHGDDRRR